MITDTTAKKTYTIEEGIVSYPIGFVYQLNVDGTPQIKLYLNRHPELPLVYGEDYELSGDGLNVVLLDSYEVGDKLHILRNIPNRQLSNYVIGRVDPEQIESDFDESVMRDQQLQAEIDLLEELPVDHEYRLTVIEEEIPAEASAENQLADKAFVNTHINNTSNPHSVTKAQVGLGNCDNTADLDKPISTATQSALDGKQATISDLTDIRSGASAGATAVQPADLATVATSGDYDDLLNKPTIPSAQVNSDWNANSGVAQILNKPTLGTMAAETASDYTKTASLATVATTGDYDDLLNKPTIPDAQVQSDWNEADSTKVDYIKNKPNLSLKQDVSNLVTSVSAASTDAQYPSAKLFYDTCGDIETLINAL